MNIVVVKNIMIGCKDLNEIHEVIRWILLYLY